MHSRTSPPDYVFLSLVGILVVFGLVVLASASSVFSYEKFGSSFYLVRHQILFGALPGVFFLAVFLRIPYRVWKKLALPAIVLAIVCLALVLIPGVGRKLGGARSWFAIGAFSFQPSEIAKLAMLLYLSAWFEDRQAIVHTIKRGLFPPLAVVGMAAVLILLQPDIGTLGIVGLIIIFVLFISGVSLPYVGGLIALGAGALALLVRLAPYRAARLAAFIHPELDPRGIGYHINQALLAVGSGGFFGVGLGNSRQKFRYLPEVTGDSIFPILAEELGFFISTAFIVLVCAVIWRMFKIAAAAPDSFSKILVGGIAGWIGMQSLVNIGSMVGMLPLTGLPLPFISYGGTALAVELAAVGIVGAVSRDAR